MPEVRTPKSFSCSESVIILPFNLYSRLRLSLNFKCKTLHLSILNFKSHLFSHNSRFSRSLSIIVLSEALSINFKSSANILPYFSHRYGRSLIKIINSNGPKTDPCGIPDKTSLILDSLPSTETLKVLPVRKS